ncbi:hypothetical protein DY000_02039792 [Brassica cretica]|uniref:Uncharacterized protein n=1 Tax=Brassica cretica TaxID=69181 RepID=A0ABQ7B698_BRACR|nr:hypothetical protein DY000_02039792 [Brassica cretica]
MVGSGLFTLLKVECDKIRAAPREGCLLTLVEGIKPFVVRLGVKDLVSLISDLEMLETSVLVLGQDLGLITALGGAMTTSTYVYEGAFIEEGNFVEKWFFRRLRRLAMLKIDFSLAKFAGVIRVKMADSRRKRISALGLELHWMGDGPAGTKEAENSAI